MFIEFPPVSTEEWEAAARADLKGRDPGKILYRADDWSPGAEEPQQQPWPERRGWQIWAEVSELESAKRALARGAERLVVARPVPEWGLGNVFVVEHALDDALPIAEQIAAARAIQAGVDLVVPVGPLYFEEIAKFRALRRLRGTARIIARTSRWHATAYDAHVNLLRGTTEAMAAIIGGCDALIVGPFTEARGVVADELAERLALNTQLLLRDEAYFGQVADPAGGSWYIESLTQELLSGSREVKGSTAFVGVNRYPNPQEASPERVTPGRAMSELEACRLRAEHAARRPTVRLVRGTDEKMSRARAAFARDFFVAGGFVVVEAERADLTILCDADANYPATREFPVLAAGPDFHRNTGQAAFLADCLKRLGI